MPMNNIFIIFIISIFFIHLNIPFVSFYMPMGLLLMFLTFGIILIFKPKSLLYFIKQLSFSIQKPLFLYVIFVVYIITITFIQGLFGHVKLISSLLEIIYRYVICLFLCYVSIAFIANRFIKLKTIIKIIYGVWFLILVLGIVDFISYSLHIKPITFFLEQTHNIEIFVWKHKLNKVFINGLPRVQSIYVEPGFLAENIFLFLPLLYHLSLSKFKIFKNNIVNNITKKMTIPLLWINLILTFSPIWLVGCLISTLIYAKDFIIRFIKKYFINYIIIVLICLFTLSFLCSFAGDKISNSYLGRIIKVVQNLSSIDNIIEAEPSLGTRLSCIINQIDIAMLSPIIGHGHSNKTDLMVSQIKLGKSPVVVTGEMILYIVQSEKPSFQSPPFVDIFIRYGLIGIILYYSFIIRILLYLKDYRKLYFGRDYSFICGLSGTIISYIVLTLYDIAPGEIQSCFLLGVGVALIETIKKKKEVKNGKYS